MRAPGTHVDALPPPHVHDQGAYVAQAQLLTARLGLGVGAAGSDGIAGTFFGQVDFWPLKYVGIGVEGEASGSQNPGILGPSPSVSYHAMRIRGGLRVPFALQAKTPPSNGRPRLLVLSAGVGVGRGAANRTTYAVAPCDDYYESCDASWSSTDYAAREDHTARTSVSVELALRLEWRVVEVGVVTRYQTWDGASLLTFGPTFGVGF